MYEINCDGQASHVSNYFCCSSWSEGLLCWARPVSDSYVSLITLHCSIRK